VVSFLEGLKRKSRYVIALQDYSPADKAGNYLILQKGDLIVLQQENTDAYTTGWCFGENDRTGKKGDFPAECVYLLPTMNKPPAEILVNTIFRLWNLNF
jgi:myosin-7